MQLTEKQKAEGWRVVKFGSVVEQISKRVNPTANDSSRYIGLEHLDSGSIRVSRWGTDIVLKGQKLEMKKGDVLFAKRNAYLKRVSIAPFDGIFSAHGMVLRPKGDLIIHDFLPFFMQSDMFMERAVAISEGSLSPTIKWKTLANQEFPLPPRTRQEEMLELLNKIENGINLSSEFLEGIESFDKIMLRKIEFSHTQTDLYETKKLRELTKISRGVVISKKFIIDNAGDFPVYSSQSTNDGCIGKINTYQNDGNYITWTTDGAYAGTVFLRSGKFNCTNVCGLIEVTSGKIERRYLYHFLRLIAKRHVTYAGNPKLMSNVIGEINIDIPSIAKQKVISDTFDCINRITKNVIEKKSKLLGIRKKIIDGWIYDQFQRS